MKTILLILATALLGSCALPNNPPARFASAKLERVSSPSVSLARPFFEQRDGRAYLVGYLGRTRAAKTTEQTEIHIAFHDAQGALLKEETVGFIPANLSYGSRMPRPHAKYELSVDNAPANAARIVVTAVDRP